MNDSQRTKQAIRAGWDAMSDWYQSESRISVDDVHYGPLCPGEKELQIIGDVQGLRALELACGAAQNSIALAKWGASVQIARERHEPRWYHRGRARGSHGAGRAEAADGARRGRGHRALARTRGVAGV